MQKVLTVEEYLLYEQHLKRLSFDDRCLRFKAFYSSAAISMFVKGLENNKQDIVLGKFVEDNMVGALQIGVVSPELVEFAVSIDDEHRGKGFSKKLFIEALAITKNKRVSTVYANCMGNNHSMIALARSMGMELKRNESEIEAYLYIQSLAFTS